MTARALSVPPLKYESDLIHQAVPHHGTGQIGMWDTPTELVSTACRSEWTGLRPRRSMLADNVTCPECAPPPIGIGETP